MLSAALMLLGAVVGAVLSWLIGGQLAQRTPPRKPITDLVGRVDERLSRARAVGQVAEANEGQLEMLLGRAEAVRQQIEATR